MVQIGFICEGYTEQFLLQSDSFREYLHSINIDPLPIINAEGINNLLVQFTTRGIGKKTAGEIRLTTRMLTCGLTLALRLSIQTVPVSNTLLPD